jgi:hypothetical protein
MTRNQIVFFIIIAAAIGIVVLGLGLQALGGGEGGGNNNGDDPVATVGQPIVLDVAVAPLIRPWVSAAADAYNRTSPSTNGRSITVRVQEQDSLDVWGEGGSVWSPSSHPDVWIPEAEYDLRYAEATGLSFETLEASVAATPLIWGAYTSRGAVIEQNFGGFSTQAVQQAAEAEQWSEIGGASQWGFIKLAFARPNSVDTGFASLLTLAGSSGIEFSDAAVHTWLEPLINAVPNFGTLQVDPASVMATRGSSTAEIALLPEAQFLIHWGELNRSESMTLYYPSETILLNFPFAAWDGQDAAERRAAEAFATFLRADAQQQAVSEQGLRPAAPSVDFAAATPFSAVGDMLQSALPTSITPPERADVLGLLRWFQTYRTAS